MTPDSQLILVTGLSGAGKSHALRIFEDLGYYCVDNLPAALVPTFAELIAQARSPRSHSAVCVDARAGEDLLKLPEYLARVREMGLRLDTVFLEASDAALQRRYSETRRRHPSAGSGGIVDGIRRERELLGPMRDGADLVLDTSALTISELRERLASAFVGRSDGQRLAVSVVSFGFKYGLPLEADMVLDLRFLPNPYYDPELRPLTGNDALVRDYVLDNDAARQFIHLVQGLLKFIMPKFAAEPKSYLTIAVGCTGGRHRSVAIAQEIVRLLRDLNYDARIRHRDIDRDR